jgi:Ankyrin repeats (3 copies)
MGIINTLLIFFRYNFPKIERLITKTHRKVNMKKKANYKQAYFLRSQIPFFLDHQFSLSSDKSDPEKLKYHRDTLEKITTLGGVCTGATILHTISILITRRQTGKTRPGWVPQDRAWVKTARTDLAKWRPNTDQEYSPSKKTAMAEYIQHVLFVQNRDFYLDEKSLLTLEQALPVIGSDGLAGPELASIGQYHGFFNQKELTQILKRVMNGDTDRFILLSSHSHIGCLYLNEKDQKKIDFFDANHEDDVQTFDSFQKAVYYFSTQYPELKGDALNPTSIVVVKDATIKTDISCPTVDEIAALCDGGEIHYTSDIPGHARGVTVLHLAKESFPEYAYLQLVAKTNEETACLLAAAATGNLFTLENAIKDGQNLNSRDHQGKTVLMYAVIGGHVEFVQTLLAHSVQMDVKDHHGLTALDYASYLKDKTLFKILRRQRLLFRASQHSTGGFIRQLLAKGAFIDQQTDIERMTPLMIAAAAGNTDTMAALLSAGANTAIKDWQGNTFLYYARVHSERQKKPAPTPAPRTATPKSTSFFDLSLLKRQVALKEPLLSQYQATPD